MFKLIIYAILATLLPSFVYTFPVQRKAQSCSPFYTHFAEGSVARTPGDINSASPPKLFVALHGSTYAEGSYGEPLQLFLEKPKAVEATKDEEGIKINSVVAEGATINSTFSLLYGRISFNVSAPTTPGVVTAVIIISETSTHDEIDVEILGADPHYFQSNVFVAPPPGKEPLFGVYSGHHQVKKGPIDEFHVYTIDWTYERIIWSVDGKVVRALKRADAKENFPTNLSRIQLGIWDGSNPGGTAQWSGGPIDWFHQKRAVAQVSSVSVECE